MFSFGGIERRLTGIQGQAGQPSLVCQTRLLADLGSQHFIGASTAIFSVTNGVLLRRLPYRDPERLVLVRGDLQKRNVKDFPLSNADFLDLRDGAKNNFEDFAAVQTFRLTLPGLDGTPERVRAAAVSINFFRMMGGSIIAGRDFQESDGTAQQAPPAAPGGNGPAANAPPPPPN